MSDENDIAICKHCGYPVATRNMSSYCDHLHYPEACSVCSRKPDSERIVFVYKEKLLKALGK